MTVQASFGCLKAPFFGIMYSLPLISDALISDKLLKVTENYGNGSSWQACCVRVTRNHTIGDGKMRLQGPVANQGMTVSCFKFKFKVAMHEWPLMHKAETITLASSSLAPMEMRVWRGLVVLMCTAAGSDAMTFFGREPPNAAKSAPRR